MALKQVEEKMLSWISSLGDQSTLDLYNKVANGKRLRAKLILKIAQTESKSITLASVVELIHAASLLHDDVIDDAKTRRGQVSVNASDGNKTSIMLGDILYSKGFFELSSLGTQIAQIVSSAVTKLSIGELQDVELSRRFNTDETIYLDMIYNKTASLIEASTMSAALLSGKSVEKYALYGKNLGLAFQIIDDILDITQTQEVLGKPALNDFKEGKATLPYIYLFNELDSDDKNILESLHLKTLDDNESIWIKNKMKEYKVVEKSYALAQELSYEAIKDLEDEPELVAIVESLMSREF